MLDSTPERGFTDLLLDQYGIEDDATFDIVLPGGEVLKFRAMARYEDVKAFNQSAAAWYQSLPEWDSPEAKNHMWAEHLPHSAGEAIAAYTIAELSVEPKIGHLDALRLLKAPWLVNYIMSRLELGSKSILGRIEALRVEQAKNDSGATDGNEPNSPSPETSTVVTTTI